MIGRVGIMTEDFTCSMGLHVPAQPRSPLGSYRCYYPQHLQHCVTETSLAVLRSLPHVVPLRVPARAKSHLGAPGFLSQRLSARDGRESRASHYARVTAPTPTCPASLWAISALSLAPDPGAQNEPAVDAVSPPAERGGPLTHCHPSYRGCLLE